MNDVTVVQFLNSLLNVVQVIVLAYIAARYHTAQSPTERDRK